MRKTSDEHQKQLYCLIFWMIIYYVYYVYVYLSTYILWINSFLVSRNIITFMNYALSMCARYFPVSFPFFSSHIYLLSLFDKWIVFFLFFFFQFHSFVYCIALHCVACASHHNHHQHCARAPSKLQSGICFWHRWQRRRRRCRWRRHTCTAPCACSPPLLCIYDVLPRFFLLRFASFLRTNW